MEEWSHVGFSCWSKPRSLKPLHPVSVPPTQPASTHTHDSISVAFPRSCLTCQLLRMQHRGACRTMTPLTRTNTNNLRVTAVSHPTASQLDLLRSEMFVRRAFCSSPLPGSDLHFLKTEMQRFCSCDGQTDAQEPAAAAVCFLGMKMCRTATVQLGCFCVAVIQSKSFSNRATPSFSCRASLSNQS